MYDMISMEIASSGMAAQRVRIAAIASNLANAQSTRAADGSGPYQRQMVVLGTRPASFFNEMLQSEKAETGHFLTLDQSTGTVEKTLREVQVLAIQNDPSTRKVYDPAHPDADGEGYVTYPDISVIQEMTDMISAERNYGANLAVFKNTRDMILQLVDILKS